MATTSIIGTEEKFSVRVEPLDDVHVKDYDFNVKVYSNKQANVIIPKKDVIFEGDDSFLITVDTSIIGLGVITIEVIAHIPDADFDDNTRTEIARYVTDTQVVQ